MKLYRKNLRTLLSAKTSLGEKGQSLAEVCISMVVLVMILSGVLDIGRAYFAYIALEDSAGEAALFMSVFPNCPYELDGSGNPVIDDGVANEDCDPPNNALWRAQRAGGTTGLVSWTDGGVVFTVKCYDDANTSAEMDCVTDEPNPGDLVIVTIDYQFRLLSPVIPNISGAPTLKLTGTASELIVAPRQ